MRTGGFIFPRRTCFLNRPTVVMFCGGGQDSHALIYQYVYEPAFRERYVGDAHFLIVMSDTGDEHDDFYAETLAQLRVFCQQHGIEFYFVTSDMGYHSEAWSSLMGQMRRNDNVMGVAFPKSCTDQLKIQVCYRFVADWMRHAYGFTSQGYKTYYEYLHYYGTLVSWIGFAADELDRVADTVGKCGGADEFTAKKPKRKSRKKAAEIEEGEPSQSQLFTDLFGQVEEKPAKRSLVPVYRQRCVRHVYPLIDLGMTRGDCQRYIASVGRRVPFPTNCQRCPFQGEAEIVYLYRTKPTAWYEWVEREEAKLRKFADKPLNLGVKGKLTLPQYLEKALQTYGDWSIEQLADYRMSHGHCIKSKI